MMKASRLVLASLLAITVMTACGSAPVAGSRDEPIKVLLVGSDPTWAFRYFRSAWGRADEVTLAGHLSGAGGRRMLGKRFVELPESLAAWQEHDVVVLCEWDCGYASDACVSSLVQFVSGGGGLITFVEGEAADSYRGARWQDLLPVQLRAPERGTKRTKTALTVAAGAQDHPAMQFCNVQSVEAAMAGLPPIYFQPSAVALADDARPLILAEEVAGAPANTVMAIHPVGEGQCLWIGSAEFWRWRDPHAGLYMDAFAVSAVRAVAPR